MAYIHLHICTFICTRTVVKWQWKAAGGINKLRYMMDGLNGWRDVHYCMEEGAHLQIYLKMLLLRLA